MRACIHIQFWKCSHKKCHRLYDDKYTTQLLPLDGLLSFHNEWQHAHNFTSWFGIGQWVHVKWKLLSSHETLSVHSDSCSISAYKTKIENTKQPHHTQHKHSPRRVYFLFIWIDFVFIEKFSSVRSYFV